MADSDDKHGSRRFIIGDSLNFPLFKMNNKNNPSKDSMQKSANFPTFKVGSQNTNQNKTSDNIQKTNDVPGKIQNKK